MNKQAIIVGSLLAAASHSYGVISLDFSDFAAEVGASTTFSTAGDTWRASEVLIGPGTQFDALFTFTNSVGVSTSQLAFVDEAARGDDARVRLFKSGTNLAYAEVLVTFVEVGTTTPIAFGGSDDMVVQFDDLDSDLGLDRSDFAGVATSEIVDSELAPDSLLEFDSTLVSGFTSAVLEEPWGSQANVSATDPVSQSPVTAAFGIAAGSYSFVVGVVGSANGNRHVDIDMTPDFTIIPEASSFGFVVGGLALAGVFVRRRR